MAFKFGDAQKSADTNTGFEPIAAGRYDFEIEDVKIQPYTGSDKIKPCDRLHIQMRVDLANGSSRKVWDDIYLDDTHSYSMKKLKSLVASCGISMPASAEEKEIAEGLLRGIGKADIIIRTWNGKKSNQVSEYIVAEPAEEDLPF